MHAVGMPDRSAFRKWDKSQDRPLQVDPRFSQHEQPMQHCICAKPSRDWPQAAIPRGQLPGDRASAVPLQLPQMRPVERNRFAVAQRPESDPGFGPFAFRCVGSAPDRDARDGAADVVAGLVSSRFGTR